MSYNTLVKTVHDFMNGTEQELIRENANKNASVVSTHRDLLAGILSKHITINSLLPEHIAHWHESGYGHVHDTDYWLSNLSNCSIINYPDMLSNGFVMGGVHIETPKSIGVAATVLTQIIQSVANSQYGGQTVAHIDRYLAPYVEASFNKLLAKKEQYGLSNLFILDEIRNEVSQAMQTFIYQCSTMASGNGQTAFITISLGLDTTTFGRMITEEYLKCHIAGLGKLKETPVFPKVIFMLQDGINLKPSDPNYHLKKLAIECSVKRIYPDYISVPLVKEVTGTKSDATTPMGCVDGGEVVTYKFNGELFVQSFKRMWEHLATHFEVKEQECKGNYYIDVEGVQIRDEGGVFTNVRRLVKNWSNEWVNLNVAGGRTLRCTVDHPMKTNRGRVFAKDLTIDDVLYLDRQQPYSDEVYFDAGNAWLLGMLLCDSSYVDTIVTSIAATGEDDIEAKIKNELLRNYNLPTKTILQNREGSCYKDVKTVGSTNGLSKFLKGFFGGQPKRNRQIPSKVFSWDKQARVAFVAGMIDADGYISNSTGKTKPRIQIGSTNKELALQQAALLRTIGCDASVYENRYNSKAPEKIRWRVECAVTQEIIDALHCQKKKDHMAYTPQRTGYTVGITYGKINNITKMSYSDWSYDVTTDSDTFSVSGLISHNCRSFLAQYKDKHGKEKISGRMNLGVVSLNLPLYALDASGNPEAFFELLRSNMETALEVHMLRVNRLKKTKASHNPIMFQHGAVARLEPDQTIEGLFYDGRSSISVGFVGLSETVQILKGKQDKQTAMEILKFMKAVCNEFKERTRLSFSLYGTPAESLCYKFAKAIKEIHKNSFEHDFLTNSFHQPVYEKTTPIDKWLYEEGFANVCSGGFISYVEQPNLEHNTEAYEALVDFAYNHVPYYGINTPVDRCYVCGSTHEFIASESGFSCSECGNTDKTKMNVIRRVSGYLSAPNVRPFNKGKTQEICKREKHQ